MNQMEELARPECDEALDDLGADSAVKVSKSMDHRSCTGHGGGA